MGRKVIDVSSHNGRINWNTVKESNNITGVVIKIIMKNRNVDSQFENNWKGCTVNNINIDGVYNYSYATTVDMAAADANAVIKQLQGRKATVWFDTEDSCQQGLKDKLIDIILVYKATIEKAGLEFGIYTGLYFYNTYIKPYAGNKLDSIKFWIARYPYKNQHPVNFNPDIKYQPTISNALWGWQYSSTCQVTGIDGNCDISMVYEDIKIDDPSKEESNIIAVCPYKEPTAVVKYTIPMTHNDGVKWIQYHLIRKGYLDKLDSNGKSSIDGYYGNSSLTAVKALQKANNVVSDGIVGAVTRSILKS